MLLLLLQLAVQQVPYVLAGVGRAQKLAGHLVLLGAAGSGCWAAECAGRTAHSPHQLQAVAKGTAFDEAGEMQATTKRNWTGKRMD
jgi:hypothetical protein